MLNPSVAEHLAEDAASLWLLRNGQVHAPNVRLPNLVRFDERLTAQLDALTRSGTSADGLLAPAIDDPGQVFVRASRCLIAGKQLPLDSAAAAAVPGAYVSAVAWVGGSAASRATDQLQASSEPVARAILIAAFGARRADPGQLLPSALSDPTPLVRARAFRTIGQLGRLALLPQLLAARADPDPECRFWAAWSAARLGATEPFGVLAEIARGTGPRADAALEMLLRRVPIEQGNAWLSAYSRNLPDRRRSLVRATGILGDPLYIPWLLACMEEPDISRVAGEAVAMITGLDIAYLDMDRDPPEGFEAGPNDDPADENVALDEDEWLRWPDPRKIGAWWGRNAKRFPAGTAFFLGEPKQSANWLAALSDAFQRQRLAAAMELAIRQPGQPMFEARARGRLQRQQLAQAMGGVSSAGSSAPS